MNNNLDSIFETPTKAVNVAKSTVNNDDLCSDLDTSALLAKASVPFSHRRIADNYVILRKIC